MKRYTNISPDRNLAMELVRITEAAISSARYMGTGNKEIGDQAAVDAMRAVLDTVDIDGTVIIGEGEKDEAPLCFLMARRWAMEMALRWT